MCFSGGFTLEAPVDDLQFEFERRAVWLANLEGDRRDAVNRGDSAFGYWHLAVLIRAGRARDLRVLLIEFEICGPFFSPRILERKRARPDARDVD